MEPTIPTSFIPKRPVDSGYETVKRPSHSVGLLSFIATLVVLVVALSWGGIYFYSQHLARQKQQLEASIDEARKGVGSDFVADMKRLDSRIASINELIRNHVVVTPIFKALEETTLRSVQYKSFGYSIKSENVNTETVAVELTGAARSYATIALQSDAYGSSTLIKNPVFSSLSVDDKARTINFNLSFFVPRERVSYQMFIDSIQKPATQMLPQMPVTPQSSQESPVVTNPTP